MIKEIFDDGDVNLFEFDKFGNEIKVIFFDGSILEYEYDRFGNKL